MSCQNNQRKDSCVKSYAICVAYEGEVPSYSDIAEEPCVSIEEVAEDLYSLVTELREVTNVTDLDFDCLIAPTEPTPVNVVQLLLQEVCALKELVASQGETIETMQAQIAELQNSEC